MARLLLSKGYEVWGTSRAPQEQQFTGLRTLGVFEKVRLVAMRPEDFDSVLPIIAEVRPHEIYNFSAQSSVGASFHRPAETVSSILLGTLNQLEAIRLTDRSIRFYNAGSSECFGSADGGAMDENAAFVPSSPYAVAKAAATWQVCAHRKSYDLFACTGILFNHESPLRSDRFVTAKVVSTAHRIALGSLEKLKLGNMAIRRDWGWAPEYVDAMWRMLNHAGNPEDFVIATGTTLSLQDFVATVFAEAGLDWERHVEVDRDIQRPSDPAGISGNPKKARLVLQWQASTIGSDVARTMYRSKVAVPSPA